MANNAPCGASNLWGVFTVIEMRLAEPVQLDQNRLVEIVARLGARGADDLISQTIEELAILLANVQKAHSAGHFHETEQVAMKIRQLAAHVGMPVLSSVAQDVAGSAKSTDAVATAATVARLSRCGEASLLKIWDLQGQSM